MKSVMSILLVTGMLLCGIGSVWAEAQSPLTQARQLLKEKSYALAARQFEQALSGKLSPDERREALYGRAGCAVHLGEHAQARSLLEKLTDEAMHDRWHGLALWRLATVSAQDGIGDAEATTITAQLKDADIIIREKAPEEYGVFLRSVIDEIFPRWWPQNAAQKSFQIDFYQKAIASTKELADVAELHRRLADFKYGHELAGESHYLRDLRNIVAEFPQTVAARQAQVAIAQHFAQKDDLKTALEEWKQVSRLWPGTPEAKLAERAIADIVREFLDLHLDPSYPTGKPIRIDLVGRNVSECRLEVFRVDPNQLLMNLNQNGQVGELVRSRKPLFATKAQFPTRVDYRATTTSVVIDPSSPDTALTPGVYVVRCASKEATAHSLTVVGNLALLVTSSGPTAHFWVVSADSGRPRHGAKVTVRANARLGTIGPHAPKVERGHFTAELTTDENGFAHCEFERSVESLIFSAVAQDGDEWAIVAPQHAPFWRDDSQTKCYAYTDRPAYRPGDTVGWKAIIRDLSKGQYVLPADAQWRVTIYDPRGAQMGQDACKLSEYGSITGLWTLPKNAPLGLWRIALADERGRHVGQATFRVEEYKKPEFEVSVVTREKLIRWGTSVSVSIQAKYLFGAPVAGATVHYTITAQPQWWFPTPEISFSKYDWFVERHPTDFPPYYYRGSTRVAEGDTITDSEGKCEFSFLAAVPNVSEDDWSGKFYNFTVIATVTDSSRRAVDGSKTIPVGSRALRIYVSPAQHIYAPGDLAKFSVRAVNLAGEPVEAYGKIAVERLVWDPIAKKDILTTLVKENLLLTTETETIYEWRIPKDFAGRVRVLYVAEDPFGGTAENSCVVDIGDSKTRDLAIRYQGITVHTDKEIYEIGEKARLLILSEYPDSYAWLWIDSGSGLIDKQVINLRYRSNFLELPITEEFVPNASVRILVLRDHQVYHAEANISVPPARQVLKVDVTTDKDSYHPRQKGTLLLTVRSWDGEPVKGEFSLAIYDKAIEYVQKNVRPDIRRFFYSSRRAIPLSLANSLVAASCYHETVPPPGPYDYEHPAHWRVKESKYALAARDEMLPASRAAMLPSEAAPVLKAGAAHVAGQQELAEGSQPPELTVRTDFKDSILWLPQIVTNSDGIAQVNVTFPDSLTTWHIETVGIDEKQRVGECSTTTLVQKSLSVRLALPRFLVERDVATISAIARNDSAETKSVTLRLEASGDISWEEASGQQRADSFTLSPHSEKRLDRIVRAQRAGATVFRAAVWSSDDGDACETTIPVIVHGMDKSIFRVGATTDVSTGSRQIIRSADRVVISDEIVVPAERVKESSLLRLQISPSVAVQLRQALPYLVEYPYGCVEQTMSRFLPAAIVAKTFQDLEIPRDEFLEKKLPDVIRKGIERLENFQQSDGSWGWWKGSPADDYMTAHVMFGLCLAREADYAIPPEMFDRGMHYLERSAASVAEGEYASLQRQDYAAQRDLHTLAYQSLVLTLNRRPCEGALRLLWQQRDRLAPVGLAMLARALWLADQKEKAEIALRNLMNYAVFVDENDTIHWESREGQRGYWWWHDRVEATCFAMMALLDISPERPELDRATKWLVLNRRGAKWNSTKDTGLAVMALSQYLKKRKYDAMDARIAVTLGDMTPREFHITKENFFSFSPEITLEGRQIPSGKMPMRIEVMGDATIAYSLSATYFSLEEPITSASHELIVERRYERHKGSNKQQDGSIIDEWTTLREGDELRSGDKIRVTLQVRALNDYEYLVFEDPKPAGCEAVEVRSGWSCSGICGYREYRDQQVISFISHLPQGIHEIQYELRAETPGRFHTLPARGYAMYCPEVYGNSDEIIVTVMDKK
ncbi:MAG: MG2 domain-containing protein [Candidatus Sumerlaeaceae bacterium]|nr:MG2 domain-containing protein [Candidatus Sumerlaeaceae bacterium]